MLLRICDPIIPLNVWLLKPLWDLNVSYGGANLEIMWLTGETFGIGLMTPDTLEIISLSCLSSFAMMGLIPGSWVLCEMLNILSRSWETGPLILGVAPSVKIGACLNMKSPVWRSENGPVLKFRVLSCKIKDEVGIFSTYLLKLEHNASI